jgi:hypothetical protein
MTPEPVEYPLVKLKVMSQRRYQELKRLFGQVRHAAQTWDQERRVLAKAVHTDIRGPVAGEDASHQQCKPRPEKADSWCDHR